MKRFDFRSHNLLNRAVQVGLLARPAACEGCGGADVLNRAGRSQIEAHHDDYNAPLTVRWLCKTCHKRWHLGHAAVEARPGLDLAPFEALVRKVAVEKGIALDETDALIAALDEGPLLPDEDFPL